MKKTPDYLLALDTSGDVCGVVLLRDGLLLAEHTFRHEMHLSERLMDEVDTVLKRAGIGLSEVASFAVGIGPGSFTGTRIGVMTVKTFAAVLDRLLYGVDGLAALAEPYTGLRDTVVVPILPCRAGVIFTCLYDVEKETPVARMEPAALSLSELVEMLRTPREKEKSREVLSKEPKQRQPRAVHFCGAAVARYQEELIALSGEAGLRVSFGVNTFPTAASVARLAYLRRAAGIAPDDSLALVPLYIAPPPITQPKTPIPQT